MNIFSRITIGQEAVVPGYGLGRVVSFRNDISKSFVEVKPYISEVPMKFDPKNVHLIKLTYDHEFHI